MTRLLRPLPLSLFSQQVGVVLRRYLQLWPVLALGCSCFLIMFGIFLTTPPALIRNLFIKNSFLPIIGLAAVGHCCIWSVLFLNSRRGSLLALFFSTVLFLKLQQLLTTQVFLILLVSLISIELLLDIIAYSWKFIHARRMTRAIQMPKSENEFHPTFARQRKHGRQRQHHFFGK